jgi:DNA-directed RNA polymerase subunit RPC12/RpoP
MSAEVIRLKNAPKGEPYAIERETDLTADAASEQASTWWESKGTLAVVVTIGGKEDARYEREYMDASRVPEGWVKTKPRKLPPKTLPDAPAPRPQVAPTLVNTEGPAKKKDPRVVCTGCGRNVKVSTVHGHRSEADPTDAACCATCGIGYTCSTCGRELPKDRKYDGDDDSTPSGRLNANRCPRCGADMRGTTRRQVYKMYTGR